MVEAFAQKISKYLVSVQAAPEDDQEIIAFGLFHILSSAIQIFILAIFAYIFNILPEIAAYSFCFTSLKRYIGGAHAKKHWICLWGFTFMAFSSCFLCSVIPPDYVQIVTVIVASIMLLFVLLKAPVPHPNNPKSAIKLKALRKTAITIAFTQLLVIQLACLFTPVWMHLYILCGAMGGFSAAITLIVPIHSTEEGR